MTPMEQEAAFQTAYKVWEESGFTDKKAWDRMFLRVIEACKAIALKINKKPGNDKLTERAMDAAIYFMNRIRRDKVHPEKLSSWCYLGTKGFLLSPKAIREDRELSLEELNMS